jgi:AcrR family transcriptional regulator
MSPRPQVDHIRKPQILKAAGEVIARKGVEATRIADVAEAAGTSPSSVIYWFESRDELLAAALTFYEDTFYEELTARLADLADPRDKLVALIDSAVGGQDWVLWMELWIRALRDRELAAARQELDERWRSEILNILNAGLAYGVFETDTDTERATLELAALIDGLAVQVALGDGAVSPDHMRTICIDVAERILAVELDRDVQGVTP